jgi:2-polyprenyl-6-methoxyphenol hydroxylase-like FAD-dependent oxidoreductase
MMPNRIWRRGVVIGAGMGGLAAAQAVSPYLQQVTVLERDDLPDEPAPRTGTPQDRHIHGLLPGGFEALDKLFPNFRADLERAGAVKARGGRDVWMERAGFDPFPQRDLGYDMFGLSRPLLEHICRRRLAQEFNVEVQPCSRVTELIVSPDQSAVVGVSFKGEGGRIETIAADLTVDASGRAAPTLALLAKVGLAKPEVLEIGIDLAYSTALFEIPDDAPSQWVGIMHLPNVPDSTRAGFLFPIENHRWLVALAGMHGVVPPSDIEGFLTFAKTLRTPTLYDAIKGAHLIGNIARYSFPSSVRRRFDKFERFPVGLIPIADSICRFNPIFGQGMSVAAQEAVALGRLLERRLELSDPLDGLAEAFLSSIQELLESPWAIAETDFAYEQTRGARPPDLARRLRRAAALIQLAAQDEAVHKVVFEVRSLLKPHSALRGPWLESRVRAMMESVGGA